MHIVRQMATSIVRGILCNVVFNARGGEKNRRKGVWGVYC